MCIACAAISLLPLLAPGAGNQDVARHSFTRPIDAVSVTLPSKTAVAAVRGREADGDWTEWEALAVDDEQDPTLFESNLVLFPEPVTEMEFLGTVGQEHPIRIDDAPPSYALAGLVALGTPRILSREDWGADDDLLYTERKLPSSSSAASDGGIVPVPVSDAATEREEVCEASQRDYPNDFKTVNKQTKGENGETLLWAHTYSKEIDLIVVHHTAVKVSGDSRSGVERVRALYQYHAVNRGWGDVGYHYLIDENGQIYEGKAGGKYVVAGHAYCHNVNTLGIALLGNFEVEKPSQDQMKALQWLIDDLSKKYDLDLDSNATYHGEVYSSPILGHGDLLSTSCPGFYVRQTLTQVRKNVESGDLDASIKFPKKPTPSSSSKPRSSKSRSTSSRTSRSSTPPSSKPIVREGMTVLGSATLGARPGGEVPFSVRYTTGKTGATAGQRIAEVKRSDQAIAVWQFLNGEYVPVRGHIVAERSVPRNSTVAIQMKVQIPRDRGSHWLTVGGAKYVLEASGRVTVPAEGSSSIRSTQSRSSTSSSSVSRRPFSSVSSTPRSSSRSSSRSVIGDRGPTVKIRLESRDGALESCNDANLTTLKPLYRGTLRCVDIDGDAAIINTVALEDYLMGLSEEPDTEPYEKQRAFAIAARTYAAHYMGSAYRKFPGKPYDGSDSPAIFQKYTGKSFEKNNPRWLDAVEDTAHLVLTKDDQIIRPPYFSSDDGHTKNPNDIGWGSFPFAEIFTSKPDPWCEGMENRGHGVGMSGCGAEGQANEGKTGEQILKYYYPGTLLQAISNVLD